MLRCSRSDSTIKVTVKYMKVSKRENEKNERMKENEVVFVNQVEREALFLFSQHQQTPQPSDSLSVSMYVAMVSPKS